MSNQKINFITYGDNEFFIQKRHLINLAKKSELFDKCIGYSPKDIDREFKNKFSEILSQPRGGGFWLWKYYIIQKSLENMKQNDLLVYSDSGSSFNKMGKERFLHYIDLINNSGKGNLRFRMEFIENEWTTKEIFNYFNLQPNSSFGTSGQFHATHMIFKKNENSLEILNSFRELLNKDPFLITDKYNNNSQIDSFKDNRHDQSILSLLSKIYGCVEVNKDETCMANILENQENYPFISTRRRYTFWQKIRFLIFYFYYINQTLFFNQRDFWFQRPSFKDKIIYHYRKLKK